MKKLGKITYNSPVILTFAGVSLAALIINYVTFGFSNKLLFSVYKSSFADPLMYVRMFTHVLGHADVSHYMSNMMLFLILGPGIEEKYGSRNTLFIIAGTAFITGLLNILLFPRTALLGASGVVFCFIILSSMTSIKQGQIPLTLIIVAVLYIGQEVFNAIAKNDNVSQFAHIIGGACGCGMGYGFDRLKIKKR